MRISTCYFQENDMTCLISVQVFASYVADFNASIDVCRQAIYI
jgi:hypothetical protein